MIPIYEPYLTIEEEDMVVNCIRSTWISSIGPYIQEFEQSFAERCGARHAIAVSTGTAALHLALYALGIGPGDEVIVPSLTFVATANAIRYTGATPVFVDSDQKTWNISVSDIAQAITSRTKAILPVHLYGLPAYMEEILSLAKRHELLVLEDAAEAHFAQINGRSVGTMGNAGAFSFYGNKIVTTGEGGMVITDEDDLAARIRSLRNQAMSCENRYWHAEIGFNYQMTNVQAAIGLAQMQKVNLILKRKAEIADQYQQMLSSVPGITLRSSIPGHANVHWLFSIVIEPSFVMHRDRFIAYLKENGIDSRPFFVPLHTLPMYESGKRLPVSEFLGAHGVNLPSSPCLTPADIQHIVDTIRKAAYYA
jgi:perosamine synthetase